MDSGVSAIFARRQEGEQTLAVVGVVFKYMQQEMQSSLGGRARGAEGTCMEADVFPMTSSPRTLL